MHITHPFLKDMMQSNQVHAHQLQYYSICQSLLAQDTLPDPQVRTDVDICELSCHLNVRFLARPKQKRHWPKVDIKGMCSCQQTKLRIPDILILHNIDLVEQ